MVHYDINNILLKWVQEYLLGRSQKVVLDNSLSDSAPVLSEVLQGAALGPLLFLIYIYDLPKYVSTGISIRLFSDDSTLYRVTDNFEDQMTLKNDIRIPCMELKLIPSIMQSIWGDYT